MFVIRLEDRKTGLGIYHHNSLEDLCEGNSWEHPGPKYDERMRPDWLQLEREGKHRDYRFGFLNAGQMLQWFSKVHLMPEDVACYIYQVQNLVVGDRQIAFEHSTAIRIGELDKDTLMPIELRS